MGSPYSSHHVKCQGRIRGSGRWPLRRPSPQPSFDNGSLGNTDGEIGSGATGATGARLNHHAEFRPMTTANTTDGDGPHQFPVTTQPTAHPLSPFPGLVRISAALSHAPPSSLPWFVNPVHRALICPALEITGRSSGQARASPDPPRCGLGPRSAPSQESWYPCRYLPWAGSVWPPSRLFP